MRIRISGRHRAVLQFAAFVWRSIVVLVASFTLAVNRRFPNQNGEREADFINVSCWRQQAEFVSRYFHKGSMIIVEGSLRNNDYTDQNGVKHYSMEVLADNVTFGESKRSAQENGGGYQGAYQQPAYAQQPAAQPAPQAPAANNAPGAMQLGDLGDFEEILSDGEVPF